MNSIFPIITVTDLQRSTKAALESIKDYVVVQSHGNDVGLILHPELGRLFLESGMLRDLLEMCKRTSNNKSKKIPKKVNMKEFDRLIGNVIRELSKE